MSALARDEDGGPQNTDFRPPPIEAYHEIVERPLFAPTRRPPVAAAVKGSAASVGLTGVVVLPGNRFAMIKEGSSPTRSVPEGATIAAGVIEKITADGIILRRTDGHTESVRVFETEADKHAAAATAAPQPSDVSAPSHSSRPVIGIESR
jgi:hypothetical protein